MRTAAVVAGIVLGSAVGVAATWQPTARAVVPVAAPLQAGGQSVIGGRDVNSVQWQQAPEGSARKWLPPANDPIDDPHGGWMQWAACVKNAQ